MNRIRKANVSHNPDMERFFLKHESWETISDREHFAQPIGQIGQTLANFLSVWHHSIV